MGETKDLDDFGEKLEVECSRADNPKRRISVTSSSCDDESNADRILLIGAGNTVMADEGIGPRCLEAMDGWYDFPENVELLDAGTMGLSLLDNLRQCDHLVVIDAAKETGHEPGTVILFTPEDLAQNQVLHSAHDMRLVDVLNAAKFMGVELKSAVIVGVQIGSMQEWVLELTPALEAAIPIACACALSELGKLGVVPSPKPDVCIPAELIDALENFALQD